MWNLVLISKNLWERMLVMLSIFEKVDVTEKSSVCSIKFQTFGSDQINKIKYKCISVDMLFQEFLSQANNKIRHRCQSKHTFLIEIQIRFDMKKVEKWKANI